MTIAVKNINKRFGDFVALDNVSLDFPQGELTALLGPSGCGKTTLLRCIAGLEHPDSGQVLLDGSDASDRHVRERQVGFVFQHYALFKHMTVFENVAFGLRVKPRKERPSEEQIRRKVKELLELVQLDWLADRYPPQLSLAAPPARRTARNLDLRDPRPGRSAGSGRPRGADEQGACRTTGLAGRGVQPSCVAVRVRLPRQCQRLPRPRA
jgi:ABC-type sulfate/molybdate transport systems ATPase subunit